MNQTLKTALKVIWWISIVIFITLFLYKNLSKVADVIERLPITSIGLSFIAILLAKFLLAIVMHLALLRHKVDISFQRCFMIYNITQPGKYIPGSIWQFIGRIGLYREHNLSNKVIRDTLLLETFWVVFSAFFIGFILVLLVQHELIAKLISRLPELYTQPAVVISASSLLVVVVLFWKKRLFHYAKQFMFSIKALLVVSLIWLFLGFSFWITLLPNSTLEIALTYIIGLYALSYALGFVVPFAPAGIGIREAVLVMGLIPYLDASTAIVLATINRLFYIIAEVLLVIYIKTTSHTAPEEYGNHE